MAACVGNVESYIVQEAMLKIKTKDVEEWTRSQIGMTLLSKRRRSFGNGRKYKIKKIKHNPGGISLNKAVNF
jgi:hypothetical protein